ncbi:MAG: hypothetical protein ACRENA_16230, partial [Vulcanimicrobiaceae bacterium]
MSLAPILEADLSQSAAGRSLAGLLQRLRTTRAGAFGLHETGAAARPYLLASIYKALGGQMLVVVPTSDVAERTFADLLYYLGPSTTFIPSEDEGRGMTNVALMRPRDESIGALESPSERSARMTMLADLASNHAMIVVAPVAALRQYLMPRSTFETLTFRLQVGTEAGFETTQERLFALGYHRVDVVSAAGEYAVRG